MRWTLSVTAGRGRRRRRRSRRRGFAGW